MTSGGGMLGCLGIELQRSQFRTHISGHRELLVVEVVFGYFWVMRHAWMLCMTRAHGLDGSNRCTDLPLCVAFIVYFLKDDIEHDRMTVSVLAVHKCQIMYMLTEDAFLHSCTFVIDSWSLRYHLFVCRRRHQHDFDNIFSWLNPCSYSLFVSPYITRVVYTVGTCMATYLAFLQPSCLASGMDLCGIIRKSYTWLPWLVWPWTLYILLPCFAAFQQTSLSSLEHMLAALCFDPWCIELCWLPTGIWSCDASAYEQWYSNQGSF